MNRKNRTTTSFSYKFEQIIKIWSNWGWYVADYLNMISAKC